MHIEWNHTDGELKVAPREEDAALYTFNHAWIKRIIPNQWTSGVISWRSFKRLREQLHLKKKTELFLLQSLGLCLNTAYHQTPCNNPYTASTRFKTKIGYSSMWSNSSCGGGGRFTFVAQEALSSVGAQAHGPLGGLGDAGGPVTTGVPLAGGELAQLAGEMWGTLTEPVLCVAKTQTRQTDTRRYYQRW